MSTRGRLFKDLTEEELLAVGMEVIPEFRERFRNTGVFDLDRCVRNVRALNEEMPVFPLSGRTGEGFEPFVSWLRDRIEGSPKGRIAGSPNREGGRIEGAPVDRTAGYPTAESRAER